MILLLSLNPTTVMVVLMLGLWLLLGCDNNIASISSDRKDYFEVDFREFHRDLRSFKLKAGPDLAVGGPRAPLFVGAPMEKNF